MHYRQYKSRDLIAGLAFWTMMGSGAALGHSGGTGHGFEVLAAGQSAVSITFEYIKIEELSDQTLLTKEGAHSLKAIQTWALTYAYGVTGNLTVALGLPWVKRTGIREAPHHAHEEHHDGHAELVAEKQGGASGIGDLTLLGQFRFYHNTKTGTELAAIAGVKMPTGETNERVNSGEHRFETEFQPGSGSWDGIAGLTLFQSLGLWSVHADIIYTLAGEGSQATNLGDRFHYHAALSYRLLGEGGGHGGSHSHSHGGAGHSHSHSHAASGAELALDLLLQLTGEWQDKGEIGGVKDPNSGGATIYLSPGLRLSQGNWSGNLSIGVPVVNDVNGVQGEPEWRILAGVSTILP